MRARDPGLGSILANPVGYVVFPSIGKGGLVVGGAYGHGVLYEHGRMTGFTKISQGSHGLQAGGQSYTELIVFRDPWALNKLKAGEFSMGANASAVMVKPGAAASADYRNGLAVFVHPQGGVMAELSLSGQQIDYAPLGG